MGTHTVIRYHDICAGHRVVGHEGKCRHLHGHNYRVHFKCQANALDKLGRVIDFSVVKEKLCMWLEENWDHKFLAWEQDTLIEQLRALPAFGSVISPDNKVQLTDSLVIVPFNPTAENIAEHLVEVIGPKQLEGTGVTLVEVVIEETTKCHVSYKKESNNDEY